MNEIQEKLVNGLKEHFGERFLEVIEFRDDVFVRMDRDSIVEALTFLRDHPDVPFPLCVDVIGIDRFTRKERFEINYQLYSLEAKQRMHLKVRVEEQDPVVPTATGVYPSADWYEREVYDMFGVRFDGHPDLRRFYMPETYEYHPLRKDFPVMGISGSIPLPKR